MVCIRVLLLVLVQLHKLSGSSPTDTFLRCDGEDPEALRSLPNATLLQPQRVFGRFMHAIGLNSHVTQEWHLLRVQAQWRQKEALGNVTNQIASRSSINPSDQQSVMDTFKRAPNSLRLLGSSKIYLICKKSLETKYATSNQLSTSIIRFCAAAQMTYHPEEDQLKWEGDLKTGGRAELNRGSLTATQTAG